MLAAAMNPCVCGYYGDGHGRCICHPAQVGRYVAPVSGPLLDRIDVHIEVPTADARQLMHGEVGELSESIRARVIVARDRQLSRYRNLEGVRTNADLSARGVREFCAIDEKSAAMLHAAIQRLRLSARASHRILKLARTIANLEAKDGISAAHVAERIQYRSLDRMPFAIK